MPYQDDTKHHFVLWITAPLYLYKPRDRLHEVDKKEAEN